jgi:hypothetical protein
MRTDNPIEDAQSYLFEQNESKEFIKCDCYENCDSFNSDLMLDGYDGDKFFIGHKDQYLNNFKSDMLEIDFNALLLKINKQINL